MPYRFLDLTAGGRHLAITNAAQLANLASVANSESASSLALGATAPGVGRTDPTGYYAPVWGDADEAFTWAFPINVVADSSPGYFVTWGDPSDASHGYNCYISVTETLGGQVNDSGTGAYMNSTTNGVVANGSHLAHFEFRTGATRQVNIHVDNVLVAQTQAGPTGSPFVVTGNERLAVLSFHTTSTPLKASGSAKVYYWKRRLTNDERADQLLALNAA